MAKYTVRAPDGKTITLEGPDGASQADILAQAQSLYKPTAAKPAAPAAPKKAPVAPNRALEIYQSTRNNLGSKIADPKKRAYALSRFDADPRIQVLRKKAGLAPLSTPKNEVKAVAKTHLQKARDFLNATLAGVDHATPGMERLQAAAEHFLPSTRNDLGAPGKSKGLGDVVAGRTTRARSYSEQLDRTRKENQRQREGSLAGNITGQVAGTLNIGRVAGKLVGASAERLIASGAPIAARAGNILQELATLRKGQKLANTGKIAVTGGAAGAATAAAEGTNIAEGTATGAVAAPLLVGGLKVAQVATRPFRDVLRLSSADRILSRLTTSTRDALEARAARYRADTGAEPTLFELLPLADRNKILKTAVVGKDNVVEATSDAIRRRARNLGPEMSRRATEVLQPQRQNIAQGIERDIAAARGGQLAPEDPAMINAATGNHLDMRGLRREESRAIMAPYENTPVTPDLEDLFPSVPGPNGTRVDVDPEVSTVIRSAAGILRQRAQGAGVTAGDITDMISTLRTDLARGGIEGRTADRAINHLQDVLDQNVPDAGAAAREMSEAWAARSRMMEGMKEGAQTRLRDTVYPESNVAARKITNAYDTPEGTAGRALGQGNRVLTDLGGSPEEALRATVQMSRNSTGRQLAQNIGDGEAEALMRAARAQDESAQALASASNKAQSGSGDGADAEMLVQAIAGLHPSSFITTKAGAMRKLLDMTYIPETRARTIVDMIFSQEPEMMRRALRAVGNEPNGATFVKYLAGLTGQMSAGADAEDLPLPEGGADDVPSVEADLAGLEEVGEEEEIDAPEVEGDSPYAQQLQSVYNQESPELVDLIQRVKQQESGGDQSAVSSAGAVGIMQVMPDTGPEAATLAGLPWDPVAFHNDAAYNELLGIAYLSEQLRKYDGDVAKALAAYNAGPGRVDEALASGDEMWLASLPAETQDYVSKVG